MADGFNISDEFSHRSTRFFPVRDCNNCLRHYEAIYKLEKENEYESDFSLTRPWLLIMVILLHYRVFNDDLLINFWGGFS